MVDYNDYVLTRMPLSKELVRGSLRKIVPYRARKNPSWRSYDDLTKFLDTKVTSSTLRDMGRGRARFVPKTLIEELSEKTGISLQIDENYIFIPIERTRDLSGEVAELLKITKNNLISLLVQMSQKKGNYNRSYIKRRVYKRYGNETVKHSPKGLELVLAELKKISLSVREKVELIKKYEEFNKLCNKLCVEINKGLKGKSEKISKEERNKLIESVLPYCDAKEPKTDKNLKIIYISSFYYLKEISDRKKLSSLIKTLFDKTRQEICKLVGEYRAIKKVSGLESYLPKL